MKKLLVIIVVVSSIVSCEVNKKIREKEKEADLISAYKELKKDSIYTKFIGYHIVRRDGENQFFYNNLKSDSSTWESPVLYEDEGTELRNRTKLFFERNPDAKSQFDIMKRLGIKAVISANYNPKTKRFEYRHRDKGEFKFNYY